MNQPTQITVTLQPGEAIIVGTREELEHMISMYKQCMCDVHSRVEYENNVGFLKKMLMWLARSENEDKDE